MPEIIIDKELLIENWNTIKINFYNENQDQLPKKYFDTMRKIFNLLQSLEDKIIINGNYWVQFEIEDEIKEINKLLNLCANLFEKFNDEKIFFYKTIYENINKELSPINNMIKKVKQGLLIYKANIESNKQIISTLELTKVNKWKNLWIKIKNFGKYNHNKELQLKIDLIRDENVQYQKVMRTKNEALRILNDKFKPIKTYKENKEREFYVVELARKNIMSCFSDIWKQVNKSDLDVKKINQMQPDTKKSWRGLDMDKNPKLIF